MAQSLPRFCPRCGAETLSGQKFCPKCGWDTSKESQVQPSTQSSEEQLQRPSSGQSPYPPTMGPSALSGPASNPELGPVANPTSNPGLEPVSNLGSGPASNPGLGPASNPGLEPASNPAANSAPQRARIPNPPSRPVPRRPSQQSVPSSLEPASKPPSRPALEPLQRESYPSSNSMADRTMLASSEAAPFSSSVQPSTQTAFPSLDPPILPTAQPDQERKQWDEQSGLSTAAGADDAIDSMPTQMLLQAQAQPQVAQQQPYEQAQPQQQPYTQVQPQAPQPQPYAQQQPYMHEPPQSQSYAPSQAQPGPQRPSAAPKRRMRVGRVAILVVLLILALGGGTFGIIILLQKANVPTQPTITTTTLGTIVNYAGVDVTVINAKKSQSFLDDPNSTSDGMLRIQLSAQNKTALAMNLPYETIAHVTLPSGKTVSPLYVKSNENVKPNATQNGFMDFAVPENVRVNQVIFNLGGADEAQIDVPLTSHANVDQYAAKVTQPDKQISYYNLNWTLTNVSSQFHIDGHQASKGMRYLVLTLKVDNPLLETTIPGSPFNYVQLQGNNTTLNLVDTTLPVSFDAGASGKTGTLTFLVPQDDTSFTLTLASTADGFDGSNTNATATFHL